MGLSAEAIREGIDHVAKHEPAIARARSGIAGLDEHARNAGRARAVRIGQRDLATYVAKNDSTIPITGTASFNVEPAQAGKYFNKIQCFCFTEQTLQPGQEVNMPVLFYVDPAILEDEVIGDIEQITLSYTFHRTQSPVSTGRSVDSN